METPQHYILCPLYSAPRNKLLKAIRDIIAPGVHHSILPHLDPLLFVNIVLKGCNDVKADENVNIFKAFQHFIIESGRFKWSNTSSCVLCIYIVLYFIVFSMYWRAPWLALVATWVIQSLQNKYVYIYIAMTVDQIDGPTAYLRHGDDVFHN